MRLTIKRISLGSCAALFCDVVISQLVDFPPRFVNCGSLEAARLAGLLGCISITSELADHPSDGSVEQARWNRKNCEKRYLERSIISCSHR